MQPNIRGLPPKLRSVLGWDGLPHEVVSPPTPGVCKPSLSMAVGIVIFCGKGEAGH